MSLYLRIINGLDYVTKKLWSNPWIRWPTIASWTITGVWLIVEAIKRL